MSAEVDGVCRYLLLSGVGAVLGACTHRTADGTDAAVLDATATGSVPASGGDAGSIRPDASASDASSRPDAAVAPWLTLDVTQAQRVDVLVDGLPFTSYVHAEQHPSLRKPVLFPIVAASGQAVTRGYPLEPRPGERVDHPHQVGSWMNHGNVNGFDFWNAAADDEEAPRIEHMASSDVTRAGPAVGFVATSRWLDPSGATLLHEVTRFRFSASVDTRVIDRETTWRAANAPVVFTDDKEGLFGLRVRRELEHPTSEPTVLTDASGEPASAAIDTAGVTGRYESSEGATGEDVWGTRARWVVLRGDVAGEPLAVAILDHPDNVGFPTYWHARGYGLFAANPLGQREFSEGRESLDVALSRGESVTFRYRVVVASGRFFESERVERAFEEFVGGDD